MEEKLDRIFKEKLAGHRVTPSEGAWEQLNNQLAGKRRNTFARKLAIAASVLLFISAGIIGYNYLNNLETKSPSLTESKIIDQTEKEENKGITNNTKEPIFQEITPVPEKVEEPVVKPQINQESEVSQIKNIEQQPINHDTQEVEKQDETNNSPITVSEQETEISDNLAEVIIPETVEPEANLAQNLKHENVIESEVKKTYPKVKIIYKADKQSELVASNERNLIDKGINKITKFSDEHIITDQVKTKLRNTKEDLLALNFGKLLNKSNKDLEN